MTESAFSSSAQEIIQRPLDIEEDEARTQLSAEQFNEYYELGWTANEIISKNYMRVSEHVLLSTEMGIDDPNTPA
jgi:hypothetical protein